MMLWMRDRENVERGMEQGMKEGIRQERCSIIARMLSQGFSDEQIKSVCDTTDEEIAECRATMQEKTQETDELHNQ